MDLGKNTRELTQKEQIVVDGFEAARPGLGAIARQNILGDTGWSDIIQATPESELTIRHGCSTNSFMYRRIG